MVNIQGEHSAGGHSTSAGGHGPKMPPLGYGPGPVVWNRGYFALLKYRYHIWFFHADGKQPDSRDAVASNSMGSAKLSAHDLSTLLPIPSIPQALFTLSDFIILSMLPFLIWIELIQEYHFQRSRYSLGWNYQSFVPTVKQKLIQGASFGHIIRLGNTVHDQHWDGLRFVLSESCLSQFPICFFFIQDFPFFIDFFVIYLFSRFPLSFCMSSGCFMIFNIDNWFGCHSDFVEAVTFSKELSYVSVIPGLSLGRIKTVLSVLHF